MGEHSATLSWANGNGQFAHIATTDDGKYIWKWLVADPRPVLEKVFAHLYFCTQCGHREQDEIMAVSEDGGQYPISQLANVFFNCHFVLRYDA
jgi:hypothetical protein|tara:strand:- start:720 stop:998 length:279 start_codon:yes stop_codon:yes gene_type:complete